MSAIPKLGRVTIVCDDCNEASTYDDLTAAEARAEVAAWGWTRPRIHPAVALSRLIDRCDMCTERAAELADRQAETGAECTGPLS